MQSLPAICRPGFCGPSRPWQSLAAYRRSIHSSAPRSRGYDWGAEKQSKYPDNPSSNALVDFYNTVINQEKTRDLMRKGNKRKEKREEAVTESSRRSRGAGARQSPRPWLGLEEAAAKASRPSGKPHLKDKPISSSDTCSSLKGDATEGDEVRKATHPRPLQSPCIQVSAQLTQIWLPWRPQEIETKMTAQDKRMIKQRLTSIEKQKQLPQKRLGHGQDLPEAEERVDEPSKATNKRVARKDEEAWNIWEDLQASKVRTGRECRDALEAYIAWQGRRVAQGIRPEGLLEAEEASKVALEATEKASEVAREAGEKVKASEELGTASKSTSWAREAREARRAADDAFSAAKKAKEAEEAILKKAMKFIWNVRRKASLTESVLRRSAKREAADERKALRAAERAQNGSRETRQTNPRHPRRRNKLRTPRFETSIAPEAE